MPHHSVAKRGTKYRVVVTKSGRLARNRYGTVRDGGGHNNIANAKRQAAILNKIKGK